MTSEASVGSISHILQTAFKEDYEERKKINQGKEIKRKYQNELEEYKKILEIKKLKE